MAAKDWRPDLLQDNEKYTIGQVYEIARISRGSVHNFIRLGYLKPLKNYPGLVFWGRAVKVAVDKRNLNAYRTHPGCQERLS